LRPVLCHYDGYANNQQNTHEWKPNCCARHTGQRFPLTTRWIYPPADLRGWNYMKICLLWMGEANLQDLLE
jgi:hypothetical protein